MGVHGSPVGPEFDMVVERWGDRGDPFRTVGLRGSSMGLTRTGTPGTCDVQQHLGHATAMEMAWPSSPLFKWDDMVLWHCANETVSPGPCTGAARAPCVARARGPARSVGRHVRGTRTSRYGAEERGAPRAPQGVHSLPWPAPGPASSRPAPSGAVAQGQGLVEPGRARDRPRYEDRPARSPSDASPICMGRPTPRRSPRARKSPDPKAGAAA